MASYYVWSAAAGTGTGASWANAYTTLTSAFSGKSAGDVFYVAHDHAESTAGSVTLTSNGTVANPTRVICASRAGSVPPVSADLRATAQVSATGFNDLAFVGFTHYDGIIFTIAVGAGGQIFLPSGDSMYIRFDNCSLRAHGSATINLGHSANEGCYVEFNNTTVSFGNTSGSIYVAGTLKWRNTPSALLGTIPSVLFQPIAARGGLVECIGVDLSAAGSGKTLVYGAVTNSTAVAFRFVDCKLDAAVTKAGVPTVHGAIEMDFIRSGASGINYAVHRQRVAGLLTEETTIVRSGGASDGTTAISWKIVTTANCTFSMPFECPPIAIWNTVDGSAVTATVEGIWGGGAVPNDDDIWLEVEYLGDNSSPQGSFVNDGKANLLASAAGQTSSSETWGGSTTKFKLAVTFTPNQVGWIYARAKIGKASSTLYVDPLVTLT